MVPFMEKEREEKAAQLKALGLECPDEVHTLQNTPEQ